MEGSDCYEIMLAFKILLEFKAQYLIESVGKRFFCTWSSTEHLPVVDNKFMPTGGFLTLGNNSQCPRKFNGSFKLQCDRVVCFVLGIVTHVVIGPRTKVRTV